MLHLMIVNINNYVYGYELSMTMDYRTSSKQCS